MLTLFDAMKMGLVERIERACCRKSWPMVINQPVWGSRGTSLGPGRRNSEPGLGGTARWTARRGHVTEAVWDVGPGAAKCPRRQFSEWDGRPRGSGSRVTPISRNRRRIQPTDCGQFILVTDVSQLQGVVTIMDSSTQDPPPHRINTVPSVPSVPRRGRVDNKTCPTCGRIFAKPAHLLRHVSTHVGGRPFPCTSCKRAFSRADALARHERTVHRDNHGGGGRRWW